MNKVLVTGSAGLIGSEAVRFFSRKGWDVVGLDNNMRRYFFGPDGDVRWNRKQLERECSTYTHMDIDVRDQREIEQLFSHHSFDLIIHAAAQPSHDWAAREPLTDFSINAAATLTLLEATRRFAPHAVFIFTSTNKVYGDNPNLLPLVELETRYEIDTSHQFWNGIDESMSIDHATHSVFGASKVAADIMVQEYGRYFGLKTGIFRGGCMTGPAHSGARLHGFLAYLVRCIAHGEPYRIFGYKGKQVRDNIHSYDVVTMFYEFYKNPLPGEVYNMGGGRHAHISVLEAITAIEKELGRKAQYRIKQENRVGDHKWYISDTSKFQRHFPNWAYSYSIGDIIHQLCHSPMERVDSPQERVCT